MATIVILAGLAVMYAYIQRFPISKLAAYGIAGAIAGAAIFGAQVAVAHQPKVPCWSEMHGGAQFFRAMPFICQHPAPDAR
jgi:hypothetical protein